MEQVWYFILNSVFDQQEEEEDECSGVPTPPDSPNTAARERATSNGAIDPDVEIYAIESNESKFQALFTKDHITWQAVIVKQLSFTPGKPVV